MSIDRMFFSLTILAKIYIFLIFIFRHRAINLFLRTYQELWLADENIGQEVIIEDLTVKEK